MFVRPGSWTVGRNSGSTDYFHSETVGGTVEYCLDGCKSWVECLGFTFFYFSWTVGRNSRSTDYFHSKTVGKTVKYCLDGSKIFDFFFFPLCVQTSGSPVHTTRNSGILFRWQ